jgi:hypothetical protein
MITPHGADLQNEESRIKATPLYYVVADDYQSDN